MPQQTTDLTSADTAGTRQSSVPVAPHPGALGRRKSSPASGKPSLRDLAGAAKDSRNRSVDFFRAVAMLAVAFGHWAAIDVRLDDAGAISAGNALEHAPQMSWITWMFQVMPLFFVVGGFSSAMSLDAHNARGGRPQDWIIARLRRMLAPTVILAGTWLAILSLGTVTDFGSMAAQGAVAAAIPLWFLANYTIDTAIAPTVLPAFRRNPRLVVGGGLAAFVALEVVRFAGVPYLPQLNWVLGWLLFQVAGFAWKDGLLPSGAKLAAIAGGLWAAALAAVTVGPYPISMVNVPDLAHSPTAPPTLALMLFGGAYSATALCFAPAINRWLGRSSRSWAAVVAANTVAMSVYLWHMTAAVIAGVGLYALGLLPTAAVGTGAWWIQKLPLVALSALILAGIVAIVATFEQRALLAERSPWPGGQASMLVVAAVVSTALKFWVIGSATGVAIGTFVLVGVWFSSVRAR